MRIAQTIFFALLVLPFGASAAPEPTAAARTEGLIAILRNVKADDGTVTIVETHGREELELPRRMARRAQWCIDATAASHAHDGLCTDSSMSIRKASTAIRQPAWLNW